MSLFGELHIPAESFALRRTLETLPRVVVEIERVVAVEEILTPYFWVSGDEDSNFIDVARSDSSIQNLTELDEFDRSTLYRAEWTENVEALLYVHTQIDASLLEATGHSSEWELRIRFDDRGQLEKFRSYCDEQSVSFQLSQLHELTNPHTGSQYGLTTKQYEALVTAREMGYFRSSNVTLTDVADELDISQQSLSDRIHRGYHSLIEHTLLVSSP